MSLALQAEVAQLKKRLESLERLESTLHDTLDRLLDRVAALEGTKTLTLPEKRKSA